MKVPIAGGTLATLADAGQDGLTDIAVDATNWLDPGSLGNGTVTKVPLNGGATTTLAAGQNEPGSIALSDTNVYWTDYGSGTVMTVPK